MPSAEGEALAGLYAQGLALAAAMSENGEVWWTSSGLVSLSGTDAPGLNVIMAWQGCDADRFDRLLGYVRERGLTANHLLSAAAGQALAPHVSRRGLVPAGVTPILTLDAAHAPAGAAAQAGSGRVTAWSEVRDEAAPLVAEAFGIPPDAMRRLVSERTVGDTGLDVFLARRDGVAVSTVFTTRHGRAVGIWNMATPERYQRQGNGRAALEAALAYHRALGARVFYLGATPAGLRLYRQLGFRLVTALTAWAAP